MTIIERRISEVEQYFEQRELALKPIPAVSQFRARLTELTEGRRVPVVLFNCLDFSWQQGTQGEYPRSLVLEDISTGNVVYYQKNALEAMQQLSLLGKPAVSVIIPDSELFDDRPFNPSQDLQTRQKIRDQVREDLSEKLSDLRAEEARILTWSDYCAEFVPLPWTPDVFTTNAYDRINKDQALARKVRDQAKDSRKHFARRGLDVDYVNSIPDEAMIDKTKWYCAMYMGEGIALSISRAIVINLEDSRVKTWYLRASSNLPILTPVNPNDYYEWRKEIKAV